MIKGPAVTLCVLAYNRPKDLENTIKSFLWQNYKNSEMVIIDDKSPKDLKTTVDKWIKKDKRIRYIRNSKNLGLAANFYNSFKHCRGKYVIFLGDDDLFINPDALKEYAEVFSKNKKIGIVRSRQIIFRNSKVYQVAGITNSGKTTIYKNSKDTFRSFLLSTTSIAGLGFLNDHKLKELIFVQETVYPQLDLTARMSLFYKTAQINKYLIGVGRGENQLNPLSYKLYGKETNMMDDLSEIYDKFKFLANKNKINIVKKENFMKQTASFVPIFLPYNTLIYTRINTLKFISKILKYNKEVISQPLFISSFLFLFLPKILIKLFLLVVNKIKLYYLISNKEIKTINSNIEYLLASK